MLTMLACFVVAALHTGFFVLEAVLWEQPAGLKVFRQTPEKAAITAVLAKNQGVYNLFLAAGLIWGSLYGGEAGSHIQAFFWAVW
jgi:putative membrane protein